MLNRSGSGVRQAKSTVVEIGSYSFDWENQILYLNGEKDRRLTKKECEVLKFLCLNRGNLVKREDILVALWGENDYFHGRSLDVFIAKLRKYLSNDERVRIENVPSVGFVFDIVDR